MSIGKIGEFDVKSDNWRLYIERLEQYFLVNKIEKDLYVATLITVVGAECYELLVNLCTPKEPRSMGFSEITTIVEKHLQPKPSTLAERYKFRCRLQDGNETIADYVAVLKKMSTTCDFGATLEENLRDQFVCGLHSDSIRQRLFAEVDIDYKTAYRLATSLEAAEKNAASISGRVGTTTAGTGSVACHALERIGSTIPNKERYGSMSGTREGSRGLRPQLGQSQRARRWERGQTRADGGPVAERRQQPCTACGGPHNATTCSFSKYVCRVCNQKDHLRRVCPNMREHHSMHSSTAPTEGAGNWEAPEDSDEVIININSVSNNNYKPIMIPLIVHNRLLRMECDTGSAVSCISYENYCEQFSDLQLKPCKIVLRYYTGELVRPVGMITPLVKYKDRQENLDLFVINNGKSALLGRQWLAQLSINISFEKASVVHRLESDIVFNLSKFSSRFSDVFANGLGRFTGGKVSIRVREGVRPVFLRARPLAYALREPVERALDRMVSDGILTPVEHSDWATPIVPVLKKDGDIRICADYKLTLNKVLEVDRYPLPKVDDLLARLDGGERFSKIDLSQAYAQFELDESRKYTVINTHKGLFMYNRLVFGLASSPGIFQRRLEQLFSDLPYVGVFLDDVVITGRDNREHLHNLNKVFERLQFHGLKVKKEKCSFFVESVNYLGHVIDKHGVHACPEKVKAIVDTPIPTNVSEVRAFLGLANYYGKFIKNASTILSPLYELLRKNVKFEWNSECDVAFNKVKDILVSSEVLVHYSLRLPLVLTVDASAVGVGAVISHVTAVGERPVAFASRSLCAAERLYSQIEREALAIIFGIRKYHQYLYGREFTLRTDHKPLTYIFGDKVGIPIMAASRLQRWAILLSGYNYKIEYVPSASNCADSLSRLPLPIKQIESVKEITYLNFVETFLPISKSQVKSETLKDPTLCKLLIFIQSGWPLECNENNLKPYFCRRNEIYLDGGCIMWGYRVIIPLALRPSILKQLHISHMGIVKTKSLARSYVWWPNIDQDVEQVCRQCVTCASEASAPPRAAPQPWPYNTTPWSRLHVDFLGPIRGKTFLVLVDSSSKWIEIFELAKTNASSVIRLLRCTFARFGLPMEVVSDQGPPFTSAEFRDFLERNGIRQSFSPAYHPASNGAAENAVKLCKQVIKKAYRDSIDVDAALQTFLLAYRNGVHSTTAESPAMLLQRRNLRSRLDLLRNDGSREEHVRLCQQRQAGSGGARALCEGAPVWARDYGRGEKWVSAVVRAVDGTRRYLLETGDGRQIQRHIDQVRPRVRLSDVHIPVSPSPIKPNGVEEAVEPSTSGAGEIRPIELERKSISDSNNCDLESDSSLQTAYLPQQTTLTPSPVKRARRPPIRYGLDEYG